jgi:hypothetical protein
VDDYKQVMDEFILKKSQIYELINNFDYLPDKEKKMMIRYLDEFFNQAGNPRYIENSILSTCR